MLFRSEVMVQNVMSKETDERIRGQKIVSDVLPFVRAIQSPIDRGHFIKVISEKSGISQTTLTEELSRGATFETSYTPATEQIVLSSKDRLLREIIAYATLIGKLDDELFTSLHIDISIFPDAIIQEEMFNLEKKVISNKEKYFDDLIRSYKKEIHKEGLQYLQKKFREDGADHDSILQEINEHVKKGY